MSKTVAVFGTFDFLHIGHLHMLKQARRYGEELVVVLSRDSAVKMLKSKGSVQTERERRALVDALEIVDRVVLGDTEIGTYRSLARIRPDVVAIGYDQRLLKKDLMAYLRKTGKSISVVTLKPYKSGTRKSSLIKKALGVS